MPPPLHCKVVDDARWQRAAVTDRGASWFEVWACSRPRKASSTRHERIADQEAGDDDSGGREVCPIRVLMSLLRFSGSETSTTTRW